MADEKITTYSEFWQFYLQEHSKPATKVWHLVGTVLATATGVYLGSTHRWNYLPLALLPGYGCAWFAHFTIEKNRPATFRYPLWSFVSDFRLALHTLMFWKKNQK